MKSKKCSSCGQDVHVSTQVCSLCGDVQKNQLNWIAGLVIGLIALVIIAIVFLSFRESDEEKANKDNLKLVIHLQVVAENTVKGMLKDPSSAEFRDQKGPCGFVNAKNSFGGFVGYKRYIVYKDMHVLEDTNVTTEQMNDLWLKACKY